MSHGFIENTISYLQELDKLIKTGQIYEIDEGTGITISSSFNPKLSFLESNLQKLTVYFVPTPHRHNGKLYGFQNNIENLIRSIHESLDLSQLIFLIKDEIVKLKKLYRIEKTNHNLRKILTHLKLIQRHLLNLERYDSYGISSPFIEASKSTKTKSLLAWFAKDSISGTLMDKDIDEIEDLSIVYVGGSPTMNPYLHTILKLGNKGYLHIYNLYTKPQFIPKEKFDAFLKSENVSVFGVQEIHVPDLEGAKDKIKVLAQKRWIWHPTKHNCLHFADTIFHAGKVPLKLLDVTHCSNYYNKTQIPLERLNRANSFSLEPVQLYFDKLPHDYSGRAIVLIKKEKSYEAIFFNRTRFQKKFRTSEGKAILVELKKAEIKKELQQLKSADENTIKKAEQSIIKKAVYEFENQKHRIPVIDKYKRHATMQLKLTESQAMAYAKYRLDYGYTHEAALYHSDPSFYNFVMKEAVFERLKYCFLIPLAPLAFVILPIQVCIASKNLIHSISTIKFNTFFNHPKTPTQKQTVRVPPNLEKKGKKGS